MSFGVSIGLYAANWMPELGFMSESGKGPVKREKLTVWFENHGFQQSPDGRFLKEWIECYIHEEENEVEFVSFVFGLPDDAVKYVSEWEALCKNLVDDLGFSLIDDETNRKVPISNFRRLLSNDKLWKLFSESNDWLSILEE